MDFEISLLYDLLLGLNLVSLATDFNLLCLCLVLYSNLRFLAHSLVNHGCDGDFFLSRECVNFTLLSSLTMPTEEPTSFYIIGNLVNITLLNCAIT
jgi:hypothetical protein